MFLRILFKDGSSQIIDHETIDLMEFSGLDVQAEEKIIELTNYSRRLLAENMELLRKIRRGNNA